MARWEAVVFIVALVVLSSPAVASDNLYEEFTKRVEPVDAANDPHHFKHKVHLRTGLGRVTHFEYDAVKHNETIHPHYDHGFQVTACSETTITLAVEASAVSVVSTWGIGWKFTTTKEHFECPGDAGVYYRELVANPTVSSDSDGTATVVLTTKDAKFSDFFKTLSMKMYSSHILHKDNFTSAPAAASSRRLLTSREDTARGPHGGRRLKLKKWLKKGKKWIKKKIIKPIIGTIKVLATGKASKTWEKNFGINWNYNKETGEAAKSLPIHGETACSSCYFYADAGYKVEVEVEHYKLESVVTEVFGDVELKLAMTNPGPAVDVKKLQKVFGSELFRVTFTLGPVPITVSLDLDVDLGLHFTVAETGDTPHITAIGQGHIRFGKQYSHSEGWKPIHSHTLDLNFDSAGGTVKADLYLYANVVPTLKLHHVGQAAVTITPAVDVGLTAALPKASCDFKPLKDKHPTCVASEGDTGGCALGLSVTPSINVELNLEVDVELFKKTIYKKTFAPMALFQKTFAIRGFPKCIVSSWSKSSRSRRLLAHFEERERGRALTTSTASDSIRDSNLTNPRLYLQSRGRNTNCPSDCSGKGFCVNNTQGNFQCICELSWTGEDCGTELLYVVDGQAFISDKGGVTTVSRGQYPQPAVCGHGAAIDTATNANIKGGLKICQGRTDQHVCAPNDATKLQSLDNSIASVMKDYTSMGYPCSAAMAELLCRISFPAVLNMSSNRIAPISFQSCLDMFTPCMGAGNAEELCSDTSAMGGSHAGISLEDSPWQLAQLPSLFSAESAANYEHTKCVAVDKSSELISCPERKGKFVHVNTDIWKNVGEIDRFITSSLDGMKGESTPDCIEANREQLCAIHMCPCNTYGNPTKMTFNDCKALVKKCPSLPEKTFADYGLASESDSKYPTELCSDSSVFFVRNFVGSHPTSCGLEPPMLMAANDKGGAVSDMAWHQKPTIIWPLALCMGLVVGAAIAALVVKHNASTATDDSAGGSKRLRNSWEGADVKPRPRGSSNSNPMLDRERKASIEMQRKI
jgi:hypothetical protein